ncbi:MAG: hypothetical protein H0X36_03270 [Sphingomonadaceae bacterium]|nr:hypothetical protein [Sphingomonadaceae bacterium]
MNRLSGVSPFTPFPAAKADDRLAGVAYAVRAPLETAHELHFVLDDVPPEPRRVETRIVEPRPEHSRVAPANILRATAAFDPPLPSIAAVKHEERFTESRFTPTAALGHRPRFFGSAWAIARGNGVSSLGTGGELGGAQAGARFYYEPGPRGVALTARISAPLAERSGREASAGIGCAGAASDCCSNGGSRSDAEAGTRSRRPPMPTWTA